MNIAGALATSAGRRLGVSAAAPASPHQTTAQREAIALTLRGVTKSFGGVLAVADVDMQVGQGEIHAIIGPNGAGKSTLLNLITGLYPADAGTIAVGGVTRARARDLSRLGVARTFQNLALFEGLTAAQNVAMGRRAQATASVAEQVFGLSRARRDRDEAARRVDEMLAFLELDAVRDRKLDGLPYGVRKRIELARAIVAEPRLLLLDEPLAGMNGADKPDMARFIRATRDRFGTSIVLIEHDVDIVLGLADRITVLDYGRRIADGTPDEIRKNPAVIAAYLGQEPADPSHAGGTAA
jgi:branched-chain amino acid transport system ATP-binding protein